MIYIIVDASGKKSMIGVGMVVFDSSTGDITTSSKVIRNMQDYKPDVFETEGVLMAYKYAVINHGNDDVLILCDNINAIQSCTTLNTGKIRFDTYSRTRYPEFKNLHHMAHNASRSYMPLLNKQDPLRHSVPRMVQTKVSDVRNISINQSKSPTEIVTFTKTQNGLMWDTVRATEGGNPIWELYENGKLLCRRRKLGLMLLERIVAVSTETPLDIIIDDTILGVLKTFKKENLGVKGDLRFMVRNTNTSFVF